MRRSTIRTPLVCAFVAVAAAGSWLFAQEPAPESRPVFRAGTEVVRLEVSVLDKDRHPVRGLTVADFTVLENGRERPVVAFTPIELPPPAAPSAMPVASWVREAPKDVTNNADNNAGRLVVIAFDWSIRLDDQTLARKIALSAIDSLGPTDQATVVFTKPSGAAAGRAQGFTADRAWLRTAIAHPFAAALTCSPPKCSSIIVDPEGYQSGECLCGMCTLEALTNLANTLRDVSQRPKVVLFIGTYVRTFEMMQPTHIPTPISGEITPTFTMMPGATDCSGRLLEKRRAFEHAAAAANITVHVLDPVGLETDVNSPLGSKRMRERLDTLPVMADMTGGRTVLNTEEPQRYVASILDESSSYYLLGFTPASSARDGKPRTIQVQMRPRGLTVKARSQYSMTEEPAAAGASSQARLTRAASGVLPRDDVPFEVSVVPMIAGRKSAAVVVGRVESGAARPTAMLTAAFTPQAAPVTSRRVPIGTVTGRGGGSGALGLVSALAIEPGFYELRVATELPGGAAGSVHTFVEMPDFRRERLAMSGVLMHVSPEEPSAPRTEIDDVLPFAPTARRVFARTDTVSAFVQVSQGTSRTDALQPVTVRMRVIDTHDIALRDQSAELKPSQFASNRTANSRLTLPVRDLPPGQYLLNLGATMGPHTIERTVRFEMR
ncbi:MAG: VWA domain-containing protein [Acidobacteriota bacterium]